MQAHEQERERVTDEQLMGAVRDGDVGRLGELFERHGRMFYGYFVRLTGDTENSNDLVQEMYLRILRYRHSYKDGVFRAWAFRIARNLATDHMSRPGREFPLETVAERPNPAAVLPLEAAESAQQLRMLQDAFAALPRDRREILTLSHFERVPYAEIADMLSCSVSAVKTRVHRAVKDLRQIFMKRMERGRP